MEDNQQLQTMRGAATSGGRMRQIAADLTASFVRLTPAQRLWGGITIGTALLSIVALLWYAARPDWKILYAGLDPQDAREMASELTAASVPFDVSPDGATLKVAAENLDKARLATTAKGGPKSGRMGFELFDKPNWIGSEFDEKVNYQRALEGELEHTIDTMGSIQSARVHLTMPHDSLFSEQQRDAKASVVLKLKHRSLSDEEADSIRNLVASAVDDLRSENVILADADGHSVLGRKSASAEAEAHEQALAEKLIETLEPVAGAGNVRASVNVDYDTSASEETDESYDPNNVVTLSMQKSQQTSAAQPAAAGVPGTASNAPNTQPPLVPSQTPATQNLSQESGTYGASKKVRHLQQGPGKVRRVTAAILINDRMIAGSGKSKQVSWQARNPEEMKRLTGLAEAAIGFDSTRGDQVSVENITFEDNSGPQQPGFTERLWKGVGQSEAMLKYGTILAAMLLLIFFVLRPAAAKTRAGLAQARLPSSAALPGAAALEPEVQAEQVLIERQKQRAQLLHESVVGEVKRDPALSSRLLQSWIHAE